VQRGRRRPVEGEALQYRGGVCDALGVDLFEGRQSIQYQGGEFDDTKGLNATP